MRQRTASLDLSAWTLKLTAMAAMLIDHVAWVFWPQSSWQGILSHTIGAMAMRYSASSSLKDMRIREAYPPTPVGLGFLRFSLIFLLYALSPASNPAERSQPPALLG